MENNRHILIARISMANFIHETKIYYDKHHPSITEDDKKIPLSQRGRKAIENHIWMCYLPATKMGKNNREINSDEVSSLLQNTKHIDDIHLFTYYKKLPHTYLERTFITIIFSNYEEDDITEYLNNALYIKSILKPFSNNGSIDTLTLEKRFEGFFLKKRVKGKIPKNITGYIISKAEHPLGTLLKIDSRTFKSFGGKK